MLSCVTALIGLSPDLGRAQDFHFSRGPTRQTPNGEGGTYQRPASSGGYNNAPNSNAPYNNGATNSELNQPNSPRRMAHHKAPSKLGSCVVGGLLGGLLGAAVSNSRDRTAAIVTGAALGCFAGFSFAANWSDRDKAALDNETDEVFDQPVAQPTTWVAPDSRTPVTFTSSAPVEETQKVEFQSYDNVAPPQKGAHVISRPYRTTDVVRLRSSPDAGNDDNIISKFNRGEIVEVIGATPDGQWAMIGDDGVIAGYTSFDYLRTLDARQTLRRVATSRPKPIQATPTVTRANSSPGYTAPPTIKTIKILASTQCKSVVAVSGEQSDRKKGCAQPAGDWKFA